MTTFQVLGRRGGSESSRRPTLTVVENPAGLSPEDLQVDAGRFPYLLGSEDLLALAHTLSHHGFRTHSVTIVDRYLSPVDPAVADPAADAVVALLRSDNGWRSKREEINEALGPNYVLNIELRDSQLGGRVQLSQEGIVTTDSPEVVKRLATVLNDALAS